MSKKMTNLFIFSWILFVGATFSPIRGKPIEEDKRALLDFLHNINHSHHLNWSTSKSVCTKWTGVTCNNENSRVIALRLPGMGLHGPIPPNTIGQLTQLQILSLRSNSISGPFPSDFSMLKNLTKLYLEFNDFSGPLPSDFFIWESLSVLDLSNNGFNGSIPLSISNLTQLEYLNLANNKLSGEIPDLNIPSLQLLNLAYNNLTGLVPKSLQRFPGSTFVGNNISLENTIPSGKPTKHSDHAILRVVLSVCLVLLVLLALLMIICYKKERDGEFSPKSKNNKALVRRKDSDQNINEEENKIIFFEGRNLAFDLEDLLRASAEILGKGTFGTTYKADLEDMTRIGVKRMKEVGVAKRDFELQMEILGNIKHENVAALRGYFYSKDEKLLVYDFHEQSSLSVLLHGMRGYEGRNPLDWEARLKIAVGSARGIAHIHQVLKLVHGNIKSSNIFLNTKGYGSVSDTGLATLMNPLPQPIKHALGYRAPEVTDTGKATRASDVYSFGVLLFEILTGKSEVVHLVRWVNSVVREEWTGEVFDAELLSCPAIEEMVEMLQVGMACTVRIPEQRPKMVDVVKMVEGIKSEISSGSAPTPLASETGSPSLP